MTYIYHYLPTFDFILTMGKYIVYIDPMDINIHEFTISDLRPQPFSSCTCCFPWPKRQI